MDSVSKPVFGRVSAELVKQLREQITTGEFVPGQYLPTVREFSETKGVARKTVHRVFQKLESEGYIVSEPRKGYRVQSQLLNPDQGCPLAYLADLRVTPDQWKPLHQELLSALQNAAAEREWTLMGVGTQGRNYQAVLKQLVLSHVSGLIIDTVDKDLMAAIRQAGLPVVAVDAWEANAPVDLVVQDSYQGGQLAAEYLVQRGHKNVAWLGPTSWSAHSLARVSGTLAGFLKHGRLLNSESIIECRRDESLEAARALLSRKNRPTGIVALFLEVAITLVNEARRMGLTMGKDVEIVGWGTEQQFQRDWAPLFGDEPVMPAVVWSPVRMAQLAVDRLEARRKHPHMTPVRIIVPVELRAKQR